MKKRIVWLDFARAFAIFIVVAIHSIERVYDLEYAQLMNIGKVSLLFFDIVVTIGRIGVPIFVAITGYLLLDRDYSSGKKILDFYKKHLLPLWLTTAVWILIYSAVDFAKGTLKTDIFDIIKEVLLLKTYIMGHMWYMPMILGIYVALPFVSNALRNISSKVIAIPFCIVLFLYFGFNLINVLESTFGFDLAFENKLDTSFLGGIYGVYLVFGLFCKRGDLKKIKTPIVWAISVLGSVSTLLMIWTANSHGFDFQLWYDFPGLFFASMFAFEGFSRINTESKVLKAVTPFVTKISVLSLGIYFIHKPIINEVGPVILRLGLGRGISFVIVMAIASVCAFILAFILSKIPFVKKLLLYIK